MRYKLDTDGWAERPGYEVIMTLEHTGSLARADIVCKDQLVPQPERSEHKLITQHAREESRAGSSGWLYACLMILKPCKPTMQ